MKYALIADIHGNLDALKAVLADAKKQGVDQYVFLGDYFGEVHYPNEVIDKVKSIDGAYVIKGNREEMLAGISKDQLNEWSQLDQMKPFCWCYNAFTEEHIQYIIDMPRVLTIESATPIYLAHSPTEFGGDELTHIFCAAKCTKILSKPGATAKNYMKYIDNELNNNSILTQRLKNLPAGIYICGHTHTQWHRQFGNNLFINPGAVGNNKDFIHGGHYSVLTIDGKNATVNERIIPYDVTSTVKKLRQSDMYKVVPIWCEIIIKMLLTDRNCFEDFFAVARLVQTEQSESGSPFSNKVWAEAAKRYFAGETI